MQYILTSLILIGLWQLSVGIEQLCEAILNNRSYYSICGTFDHPAPYAISITIFLPIAWFYILQGKILFGKNKPLIQNIKVALSYVYIIMTIIILPFSMSRTSWIAGIVACGVTTYCYIKLGNKKKNHWSKPRKIIFTTLSVLFFVGCMYGGYQLKKDSADGRLLIWKISSSIIQEHFITGTGDGSFPSVYGDAQEKYFKENKGTEHEKYIAGAPDYAYNEFIQIAAEHGIVGMLMILFIIAYSIYHLNHTDSTCRIPVFGAFVSLLTISFFSYPFRNPYTCILSLYIIILAMLVPNNKKSTTKTISRYGLILCIMILVTWRTFLSFGLLENVKTAYHQWNQLKPYFETERFDEITNNYAILYPYLKSNTEFLLEYGQCLSKTGQYEKSNHVLYEGTHRSGDPMFFNLIGKNYQNMGAYHSAEIMFYKAYYRIPHKIYPLYLLINLYKELNREKEMVAIAHQILNQKNKVHSPETLFIKEKTQELLDTHFLKRKINNLNH